LCPHKPQLFNPKPLMDEPIIALATPPGTAALAVIRLSGQGCIAAANRFFSAKNLEKAEGHSLHFGTLRTPEGEVLDEVLLSVFRAPRSFTGEDSVEISTHGSPYIVQKVIELFLKNTPVRYAQPGEFTQRAFLNGRMDLAQAEAVADLIAAESEAAHRAAVGQLRGGFSKELQVLRQKLLDFASLLELELDFSEEDVEFANRDALKNLVTGLMQVLRKLAASFSYGQVVKQGLPVVIAGKPNAGKSTLLNALLNEEKAIVSEIAGTTRDVIEDEIQLGGLRFRFIDTAGLRETTDVVEAIGVQRTREKMQQAALILLLYDALETEEADLKLQIEEAEQLKIPYLVIGNKVDEAQASHSSPLAAHTTLFLSAKTQKGLEALKQQLVQFAQQQQPQGSSIVTNARHYEALSAALQALEEVQDGLAQQLTSELLAFNLRDALYQLGSITGEVTNDEVLGNIFSKFCIGK